MPVSITQRDGFAEDDLPDQRTERSPDHDLHRAAEQIFEVSHETPGNQGEVGPTMSTRKSTSLEGLSWPRATEPKTWTLPAPCLVARRLICDLWARTRVPMVRGSSEMPDDVLML